MVLCENTAHGESAHSEVESCICPHEVTANGATWADGTYAS